MGSNPSGGLAWWHSSNPDVVIHRKIKSEGVFEDQEKNHNESNDGDAPQIRSQWQDDERKL